MYEVLSNNRVRKMPEMPEPTSKDYHYSSMKMHGDMLTGMPMGVQHHTNPEWDAYRQYLDLLPTYPISGNHNWKEGQLIPDDEIEMKEIKTDFTLSLNGAEPQPLRSEWITYAIPKQTEPSTGSEEDEKAARIRKLAWQAFKDAGLTIFSNDEPTTCDSESFAMYEQGFADAFKHIFKTTEELKKAFTTNKT